MINENYPYLKELENTLSERFSEVTILPDDIPKLWKEFPLSWLCYGERDCCIRETSPLWSNGEVMSDIINLFYFYYRTLVDNISKGLYIDYANSRVMEIYVQPDYPNECTILIIQRFMKKIVYMNEIKAWHLSFDTPDAIEDYLKYEYEIILSNVK
jgi:hypothetical protein